MRTLFVMSIVVLSACGSTSSDGGTGGAGGTATGGTAGSSTGGTATGGTAGSSTGGTGGADVGVDCAALLAKFAATLEKATECSLFPGMASCTKIVKASLECGDYAYVEATNTTEIAELAALQAEWDAAGCDAPGTCGLGGAAPVSAACAGGGQGGDVGLCASKY